MRWLLRSHTMRTGPLDVKSSGMFGWNGLYAATPLAPAAELWP
jgi:hypothetical protein